MGWLDCRQDESRLREGGAWISTAVIIEAAMTINPAMTASRSSVIVFLINAPR